MQITETLVTAIKYAAMNLRDSTVVLQMDSRSHLKNDVGDAIRNEIEKRLQESAMVLDWCERAYQELKK